MEVSPTYTSIYPSICLESACASVTVAGRCTAPSRLGISRAQRMHCSRCDRSHPPALGQRRAWVSPGPAHTPCKALTHQFRRRRLKEPVPASLVKLVASQCKQFCTMRVRMAACGWACARRLQSKADSAVLAPIMLVDNETCTLPERRDPFATSSVSCSLRAITSRHSFIIAAQASVFSHHRSGCIISDWCHRR